MIVFQKFIKKGLDWQCFTFYLPRKLVQLIKVLGTVIVIFVGIWAGILVQEHLHFSTVEVLIFSSLLLGGG